NAESRMLVASDAGRGFIVKMADVLAQTKKGKQVLNVDAKDEAKLCHVIPEGADHVAIIGRNRKFLVFGLDTVPEMARGKGVMLQKYKDGGLSDLKTFNWKDGLTYKYGSGETLVGDLNPWVGSRADVGKLPPNGFPKSNRFS
ncbi:MAG: DNA topoisomerase IV subunit A, partial [Micavibrio aeruginosavorus]